MADLDCDSSDTGTLGSEGEVSPDWLLCRKGDTMKPPDPVQLAEDRVPDELTLNAIRAEVVRARIKFPGTKHLGMALVEEVGELAAAMLQDLDRDEIEKEAIQVAAVAIRIIEEGDSSFDVKDWSTAK